MVNLVNQGWTRLKAWLQPMSGPVAPQLFDRELNAKLFVKYGRRLRGGEVGVADLSRHVLGRRAIAQYRATHELLGVYGPLWLRGLVFAVPAMLAPIALLLRRPTRGDGPAAVAGLVHYPEFAGYAMDAGGPSTARVTPPRAAAGWREVRWLARAIAATPSLLVYPEVLLRAFVRCAQYGVVIDGSGCRAVVDFLEHSPTAPLAYGYCRDRGVALVNAMHGDRGYSVVFGFGAFTCMGIWGEYFRPVFQQLLCAAEEVRITPCARHRQLGALRRLSQRSRRIVVMYETTFAIGSPFLRALGEFLREVPESWEIVIRVRMRRAHERAEVPKFLAALREIVTDRAATFRLSDPESTPMEDELAAASVAVAVYSSALLEAWLAGCRVVRIAPPDAASALYPPPYHASAAYTVYDGSDTDVSWLEQSVPRETERDLLAFISVGAAIGAAEGAAHGR